MPNNSKELQDILYRILRILLSTQVTLWVVWRQIQRGYALFLYNAKLVRQMPNNNKQATKAKNSNLYAPIYKGQALYFGWLLINKTFTSKAEAVAWYDKHQQGWRYCNAVAVVWQGCTKRTGNKWLKYALCGGEAWQLAKEYGLKSQDICDKVINSTMYEYAR